LIRCQGFAFEQQARAALFSIEIKSIDEPHERVAKESLLRRL